MSEMSMISVEGLMKTTTPSVVTWDGNKKKKTRKGTMSIENRIVYDGNDQREIKLWLAVDCGQDLCAKYFDAFVANGYESLEFVQDMESEQDLNDIGVSSEEDKARIWAAIRRLKSEYMESAL